MGSILFHPVILSNCWPRLATGLTRSEQHMALVNQLRSWQRREWLYRAVGGVARWLAFVGVVLAAACATDWLIDRTRDTPFGLRVAMTAGQVALDAAAAYLLVFRLRVPALDALASRAEAALPEFGHRLVTAVQLNRAGARTEGMSPALIAQVTTEAEAMVARHRLPALADASHARTGLYVFAPVLLLAAVATAVNPPLVFALVARQALLPVEVPRSVRLASLTPEVWPSGDEVELRFEVTGPVPDDAAGVVRVHPEGQPAESFPLTLAGRGGDGSAVFAAKLPPSSANFTYRARLLDGRTKQPGSVRFEPRPVASEPEAFVILPRYVDPDGKREYRRHQPQGEVVAPADSEVEVRAGVSKPVAKASLVLYARDEKGKEYVESRRPMALSEGRDTVSLRFPLPPRPSAYRVEVEDEYGFANLHPPRRGISLAPDNPPMVRLLPEVLKDPKEEGPLDDFRVDWMQLRLGGQIQVGYEAASPIGLDRAFLVYRVRSGEQWTAWTPLPLTPTAADEAKVGRFVPELGLFEESGPFGQVEFYRVPSPDPDNVPPGLAAGGRVNFQTAALRKRKKAGDRWETVPLEIGDLVEIRVAVYDRNPVPAQPPSQPPFGESGSVSDGDGADATLSKDPRRPAGWSASIFKRVVTEAEFEADRERDYYQRVRLRELEEKQRRVFQQSVKAKE